MNQEEPKRLLWYRIKLIALIAVFLSPFIGGWLALYVFDIKPGSGNYGMLVAPVKKLDWPLLETVDRSTTRGRIWTQMDLPGVQRRIL